MQQQLSNYFSLIKFSHTIFAMPFAFIGFFLGLHANDQLLSSAELLQTFLLVVACMVFARSAAMAFNRYLDRSIDARNPRTAIREIPSGVVTPSNALFFTIFNSVLFVATTWFINEICFWLSPVALAVVLGYSYTKRFTALCHLVLGVGLSLAPIGAYLAVTGYFSLLPLLFSAAVICWVSGFDIIYALQDEEFDRSNHLHSIPAWLGKANALRVSRVLHLISFLIIIAAGLYGDFGWSYALGAILYGAMLVYQQRLVSPYDLSRVNLAFMTANGIASVFFALFVIADLLIFH
jgi:4-hydroxybenzoate polyprenyltransferase